MPESARMASAPLTKLLLKTVGSSKVISVTLDTVILYESETHNSLYIDSVTLAPRNAIHNGKPDLYREKPTTENNNNEERPDQSSEMPDTIYRTNKYETDENDPREREEFPVQCIVIHVGTANKQNILSDCQDTNQTQTLQSHQTIFRKVYCTLLEPTEQRGRKRNKRTGITGLYSTTIQLTRYCRPSETETNEEFDMERSL